MEVPDVIRAFLNPAQNQHPHPVLAETQKVKPKPRAGQPAYGVWYKGSPAMSSSTVGWVGHTAGSRHAVARG